MASALKLYEQDDIPYPWVQLSSTKFKYYKFLDYCISALETPVIDTTL